MSKMLLNLTKLCLIFISFIFLIAGNSAYAMDFVEPDNTGNVNITESKTNLTLAGSQVNINADTKKDLIAGGSNITVNGDIERNLIAVGGNLNIQSNKIGASVRIIGGNINIQNTVIEEDLVVAGGTVNLSNVTVKGNVYSGTSNLNVKNSKFLGDANVSYGTYSGENLSEITTGKLNVSVQEKIAQKAESSKNKNNWFNPFNLVGYLGILLGLVIILIYLRSKKALYFSDIRLTSKLWIDALIGLGVLFVLPIIFVVSIFVLGFTFTWSVWMFALNLFYMSLAFAPLFLANLLLNSTKLKLNIILFSLLIWLGMVLISVLTSLFFPFGIFSLVVYLFQLSAFGYILRNGFSLINRNLPAIRD